MREDCVKSAGEAVCTVERADQLSMNGLGSRIRNHGWDFRVSGSRFRVQGLGIGFGGSGVVCRGFGFRVLG